MLVEIWDTQGPRCYLNVAHPMPLFLVRTPRTKCYQPLSTTPEGAETFRLYAILDHESRRMDPVYILLKPSGEPCHAQ